MQIEREKQEGESGGRGVTTPWTPESLARAREEAERWRGVPHLDRRAIPGVGIDCINLVSRILVAAGIVPGFQIPYYNRSLGINAKKNVMEAMFLQCFFGDALPPETPPIGGDILVFQSGNQSNHCGIVLRDRCWHSMAKSKVTDDRLADIQGIQCLFRLTACGFRMRPEKIRPNEVRP